MVFAGAYEHTIDAKQRVAIPSEIRAKLRPERDGATFYAVAWPKGIIRIYTSARFEKLAESRSQTLTQDEEAAEIEATLFGFAREIELDSAGRVRIPEKLLELTGLQQHVVIVGAGDRLEIRDRSEWLASERERLSQLPNLITKAAKKEK